MWALIFWLVLGLFVLFVALVVVLLAALVMVIAAVVSVFVAGAIGITSATYLVARPLIWDVSNRGGNRLAPDDQANSFRQYLAGPVYGGFLFSLTEAKSSGQEWLTGWVVPELRRLAYRPWFFKPPVNQPIDTPLGQMPPKLTVGLKRSDSFGLFVARAGVAGALVGAVVGVLAVGVILVAAFAVVSALCALVIGASLVVGWSLGLLERLRMRMAGAGYLCPECHQTAALPVYLCPNPACGAPHGALLPGPFGIFRQRCRCDETALPTLRSNGRSHLPATCPNPECRAGLSSKLGEMRNIGIPMAGGTAAGKTSLCIGALESLARLTRQGSLSASLEGASASQFASMVSDLGRGQEPNPTGLDAPAILLRVSTGSGQGALVFIYDVAGELYGEAERLKSESIFSAFRGAVLVVDPFSVEGFRSEFKDEVAAAEKSVRPSPQSVDHAYGRLIEALSANGPSLKGVPLAVALTKTDALPDGAQISDSSEVRDWLERFGKENLLITVENDFREVAYFATSALGAAPGSGEDFDPRGALDLFSWILAKEGVHLPTSPAGSAHVDGDLLLASPAGDKGQGITEDAATPKPPAADQQDWQKFKVSNPGIHSVPYAKAPGKPSRAVLLSAAPIALLLGVLFFVQLNDLFSTSTQERIRQEQAQAAAARQERAAGNSATRDQIAGSWRAAGKAGGSRVRYRLELPRSDGRLKGSFQVVRKNKVACEAQVSERQIREKRVSVRRGKSASVAQVVATSRITAGKRIGPCRNGSLGLFVIGPKWSDSGDLSYGGKPARPKRGEIVMRRAR